MKAVPINEAPADGTLVIVMEWFDSEWVEIAPARFETDPIVLGDDEHGWINDETGETLTPTHFLPLPEAPEP